MWIDTSLIAFALGFLLGVVFMLSVAFFASRRMRKRLQKS